MKNISTCGINSTKDTKMTEPTESDINTIKFGKNSSNKSGFSVEHIHPRISIDYVTDETRAEVEELKRNGLDIEIVDVDLSGHYQLDEAKQKLVDNAIEVYSEIPDFAQLLSRANPAVEAWYGMAQLASPLALGIFYNTGAMERPSDGLSQHAILHEPLPIESGKTATELVIALNTDEDAKLILDRTNKFFEAGSLKEGVDDFGLTPHDIMAGSLDRIGDITRAKAAIEMFRQHVLSNPDQYADRGIVSASLASGAAEPVFWLMDQLRKDGVSIDTLHLIDLNPIAITASIDRSSSYKLKDQLKPHIKNLFREPIDSYITPHSVDMVDVIGITEYLTPKAAIKLLERAKTIVRPGGMIVFGNMLKSRPQQKWFEGLWPDLKQRSITEMLDIIETAGFSRDQLKVRVSKDGLYPMYGLEMPMDLLYDSNSQVMRSLGHASSPATL